MPPRHANLIDTVGLTLWDAEGRNGRGEEQEGGEEHCDFAIVFCG
jgi:hypothetical protein